jgi:beta-mannosidase
MFRRYEVEVRFNRTNDLVVNFTASTKHDLQQEQLFKEAYGFGLPQNYSFTRKAAYQYGWDWGPRILSVGIWKEVFAVLYNDTRLDNLRFTHSAINKTIKSISCQVGVDLSHLDQLASYSLTLLVKRKANSLPIHQEVLTIKSTTSTSLSLPFNITSSIWDNVWWTWDLGQPNLIVVSIKLVNLNSLESFESTITTGIRTIAVVQEFSKTYNGTSFTFNLNGYDVYMRGGNYIPPEMSLARTTKSTYEKIKEYALFGRFNMIRLWGGGQF